MDYKALSDEKLVTLAQDKDTKAVTEIFERYKSFVKIVIRPYFLVGGDSEDLMQEGLLGVFKAIETFNGKSSFKSYVYLCVKSGILSLIRKYNSDKNKPLNNFISLSGMGEGDSDKAEYMATGEADPEENFIAHEEKSEFLEQVEKILSKLEYKIFCLYVEGYSYSEIACKLNKNEKSVDNAVQRIRKKVAAEYSEK